MTAEGRYTLEPLTEEQCARWEDLIAPCEATHLFHRGPWLDYLAASRGVDIRLWAIRDRGATVGYFCGGLVRKGPFLVLGSPLKGWGTNYMGPVVNRNFEQTEFLLALDELSRREGVAMVELESPVLSGGPLEASVLVR